MKSHKTGESRAVSFPQYLEASAVPRAARAGTEAAHPQVDLSLPPWLSLSPAQARSLAEMIWAAADEADRLADALRAEARK